MELATSYSSPKPDQLLALVCANYPIGEERQIRFWRRGLNDTYMVLTDKGSYVLRLWAAHGWLTDDFIRSQIAFLAQLMAPLA